MAGRIGARERLAVWDLKAEYGRTMTVVTVESRRALLDCLKHGRRVAYSPRGNYKDEFAYFCEAVHAAAGMHRGYTVVVEELADVTSPGKAPDAWGVIIRRGRDRAMRVLGVTQRPSESDKTIMGNRTLLVCFQLPREQDAAYIAREFAVPDVALTTKKIQGLERYCHYVQVSGGFVGVRDGRFPRRPAAARRARKTNVKK
ncbi:MAG: hypothetical protein ACYCOR_19195 [Acidobacteriaceae bacterium]